MSVDPKADPESTGDDVSGSSAQPSLTHVNEAGDVSMVDVSHKDETERRGVAKGRIRMQPSTAALIASGGVTKGNVLTVARLAGIMGAKRCADLIPLAHPLPLTHIQVDLELTGDSVEIEASVEANWKTGVEMEALTAVSVAALAVYDMCKAVDRTMVIDDIRVVHKSGGKTLVDRDPVAEG